MWSLLKYFKVNNWLQALLFISSYIYFFCYRIMNVLVQWSDRSKNVVNSQQDCEDAMGEGLVEGKSIDFEDSASKFK